jgi:hypothetical protein
LTCVVRADRTPRGEPRDADRPYVYTAVVVSHTVHLSKSVSRLRIAIGFRLSSTRAPYHNNLRKAVNPSAARFSGFLILSQILVFQRLSRTGAKKKPARFALPRHLHAGRFFDSGVSPEHHPQAAGQRKNQPVRPPTAPTGQECIYHHFPRLSSRNGPFPQRDRRSRSHPADAAEAQPRSRSRDISPG